MRLPLETEGREESSGWEMTNEQTTADLAVSDLVGSLPLCKQQSLNYSTSAYGILLFPSGTPLSSIKRNSAVTQSPGREETGEKGGKEKKKSRAFFQP